jgi:hypothetical protein
MLTIAVIGIPTLGFAAEHDRRALFGDTHIHTMYSMDAFAGGGVRTSPDMAYQYAKGRPIPHPNGTTIRLSGPPLDFLMIADHAIYLGVNAAQLDPTSPTFGHPEGAALVPETPTELVTVFQTLQKFVDAKHELVGKAVINDAWQKSIQAAERHNNPGVFTALVGYEYTPTPGGRHLHRNVMFRSEVPKTPFSSRDSEDPADLWNWMDQLRQQGINSLAIPHNMNQSDGLAFMTTTWQGEPISTDFAQQRIRNEPIAEISQQKGTSEVHPLLSPNDEWADFQIVRYYLNRRNNTNPISVFKGGYYRDALMTGISLQSAGSVNPFQMGVIGSSDAHTTGAPYEEDNYFSFAQSTPLTRGSAYPGHQAGDAIDSWKDFWTPRQATHGTAGLAGVWADTNTRAGIFDAMQRRETFATSGPRITVRMFGGFKYDAKMLSDSGWLQQAYRRGVPMGGVLTERAARSKKNSEVASPQFLVFAARDPQSSWLQRIQIIKGWVENGESKQQVFDVACSDNLAPDPITYRCPDNQATVNMNDCSISRDKGSTQLKTLWQDPGFSPDQHAFYYARVLENPTCRWSTWDALRLGIHPNPDLPAIHQERAWGSPIWYEPK